MGMDIYMSIVNPEGEYVQRNIYEWRDSEWFQNLMQNGWDATYDNLPCENGIPDLAPERMKTDYNGDCYFGFHYIQVKAFREWFYEVHPDVDAGWLSTYETWLYEKKHIYPKEISHYLDENANINDYHFVEVVNPNDNCMWLMKFIDFAENGISNEDYIVYYFNS